MCLKSEQSSPQGKCLRRSAVSRADLLYCDAAQGLDALRRSAAIFGYLAPEEETPEIKATADTAKLIVDTGEKTLSTVTERPLTPAAPSYLRLLRREAVPESERRTEAPTRLAATSPFRSDLPPPAGPAPDPPPLTPWRRLWPFLRMALGAQYQGRAIDLPRLISALSQGRTFRRLPRIARNSWAPLAQVVVDQGLSLYPFWQDFEDLVTGLVGLRGNSGLDVVGFPEGPDGGALSWDRSRRRRDSSYRLPEPGTPILIVSDLGYLEKRPDPWLAFGRRLKAAGFRPVALMPCPPRYWNDELGDLFFPVVWDRNRSLPRRLDGARLRPETDGPDPGVDALLRLVAWAVRVEPGLLRALRLLLGADRADVGSEAAVWRHSMVQNNGLTLVLRPEFQEAIRDAAAREASEAGPDARMLHESAHALLTAFHGGLHPAILAEEEMMRAQGLGIAPSPWALDFMWQLAATLDRPRDYPHRERLQAWVQRMAGRQHPDLWRWEAGEPMAIAVAKVLREQAEGQETIPFPAGFDLNRVLWELGGGEAEPYELRQEVTPGGGRCLAVQPPGGPHVDGPFGRGNVLIAPLSLSTTCLQVRPVDESGNPGPVQVLDIRHIRSIPLPDSGRLLIASDRERLEVDTLVRPAWAARIEQGRGPQGEDLLSCTPKDQPGRVLRWLPPADYPIFDQDNRPVGHLAVAEGRFVAKETYREIREQGFRQPGWAERIGQDEYGLFADWAYKGVTQRFRYILPGRLWMGSPEEEPERRDDETRHEVVLTEGYWLADTACTQALWQAVMGKNPSTFKGEARPVEQVSWDEVAKFLQRLQSEPEGHDLRLPTEAEWEYACRAGTETPFSFGTSITPDQVNYDGNYPYAGGKKGRDRGETVEVKALPCNGWGLYQMHGNVWEWCADWYGAYSKESVTDPTGATVGGFRVLRGGSWGFGAGGCRSALRYGCGPGGRYRFVGFRLARGRTATQAEEQAGDAGPPAGRRRGAGAGPADRRPRRS